MLLAESGQGVNWKLPNQKFKVKFPFTTGMKLNHAGGPTAKIHQLFAKVSVAAQAATGVP